MNIILIILFIYILFYIRYKNHMSYVTRLSCIVQGLYFFVRPKTRIWGSPGRATLQSGVLITLGYPVLMSLGSGVLKTLGYPVLMILEQGVLMIQGSGVLMTLGYPVLLPLVSYSPQICGEYGLFSPQKFGEMVILQYFCSQNSECYG